MAKQNIKYRIAFKYCGSCNPYIDLSEIHRHLAGVIEEQDDLEIVSASEKDISLIIILCGCFRACGNKEEFKNKADKYLLVAGESLMGEYVPESRLPGALDARLFEVIDGLRSDPMRKRRG